MNATTWSSLGIPATFMQFLRASANRQVILTTEFMAMVLALVDAERGLCWDRGRRLCGFISRGSETWERTASGPRSVALVSNSVGQSCEREQRQDVGWSWPHLVGDSVGQTTFRTASGPRLGGAVDANGVGKLATSWVYQRQDVGRSARCGRERRQNASNSVGQL